MGRLALHFCVPSYKMGWNTWCGDSGRKHAAAAAETAGLICCTGFPLRRFLAEAVLVLPKCFISDQGGAWFYAAVIFPLR
jgi:hypothetical protein